MNVQRELVATQQRLEEEMHVHQAVTEVVRLLRQEPRIALLVLHLLKKHQTEQHQQQSLEETNAKMQPKNENRTADCNSTATVAGCSTSVPVNSNATNGGGCGSSHSAQASPKHAAKKHSSASVNGCETSTTKPKSAGGASKKSSMQLSNKY